MMHTFGPCEIQEHLQVLHRNKEIVWLLGDSGYPLRLWLFTPIVNAQPGSAEEHYTNIHCQTRNTVECCIGVLKAHWICLLAHRVLHYEHHMVAKIINACAATTSLNAKKKSCSVRKPHGLEQELANLRYEDVVITKRKSVFKMETPFEILEDMPKTVDSSTIQTWTFNETLTGLFLVLVLYLSLVLKILPTFMKHRQPFQLNRLLTIYNAVQVISSVYIVFLYTKYVFRHGVITTRCPQAEDLKDVITDILPYFIAKHVDLLDTIFFILRKKQNQVTFLHVYHHSAMVGWTWFHYMYHPCDHFVVVGLINSFVHVVMYTYYGLASLGPEYARFVWWKKHLTKVQLIQFVLVISNLYYQQKLSPCPLPSAFHYYCLFSIGSFFILFINFYLQSYSKKRASKEARSDNEAVKDT